MKKLLTVLALVAVLYLAFVQTAPPRPGSETPTNPTVTGQQADAIEAAFAQQRSGVQVAGEGTVRKVLSDDTQGSRHQRFLLDLPGGQTLLVAHNIDLAPRIPALAQGDTVTFSGVYEWNAQGGVIHWTHRDPQGRHTAGWLRHRGETYQ